MRFRRRTEGLLRVELVLCQKAYWAAEVRTIETWMQNLHSVKHRHTCAVELL